MKKIFIIFSIILLIGSVSAEVVAIIGDNGIQFMNKALNNQLKDNCKNNCNKHGNYLEYEGDIDWSKISGLDENFPKERISILANEISSGRKKEEIGILEEIEIDENGEIIKGKIDVGKKKGLYYFSLHIKNNKKSDLENCILEIKETSMKLSFKSNGYFNCLDSRIFFAGMSSEIPESESTSGRKSFAEFDKDLETLISADLEFELGKSAAVYLPLDEKFYIKMHDLNYGDRVRYSIEEGLNVEKGSEESREFTYILDEINGDETSKDRIVTLKYPPSKKKTFKLSKNRIITQAPITLNTFSEVNKKSQMVSFEREDFANKFAIYKERFKDQDIEIKLDKDVRVKSIPPFVKATFKEVEFAEKGAGLNAREYLSVTEISTTGGMERDLDVFYEEEGNPVEIAEGGNFFIMKETGYSFGTKAKEGFKVHFSGEKFINFYLNPESKLSIGLINQPAEINIEEKQNKINNKKIIVLGGEGNFDVFNGPYRINYLNMNLLFIDRSEYTTSKEIPGIYYSKNSMEYEVREGKLNAVNNDNFAIVSEDSIRLALEIQAKKGWCAQYARYVLEQLFNEKINPASAWNLHLKNEHADYNEKNLDEGLIVVFDNPNSPQHRSYRVGTHVAVFMGINKKGEFIFVDQKGKTRRETTLDSLKQEGYIPKQIIYPKGYNKKLQDGVIISN